MSNHVHIIIHIYYYLLLKNCEDQKKKKKSIVNNIVVNLLLLSTIKKGTWTPGCTVHKRTAPLSAYVHDYIKKTTPSDYLKLKIQP